MLLQQNHYIHIVRAVHVMVPDGPLAVYLHTPIANGEMGAIIYAANMQHLRSRQIVFYRDIEGVPEFIDILSPMYEPLQYSLLFPQGSYGWTPGPSATNPTNLSQIQWYRYWLCREERFLIFGRLTSE